MPIQNDFLPFAAGAGANVITQSAYAALTALANGFVAGIADPAQCNKVWRQSSLMAGMLAQFIVDQTGQPAVDDGTIATLEANLIAAIGVTATGRLLGVQVFKTSGSSTYTPTAGTKSVIVEVLGGGGAGGGTPACSAGQISVAPGGSSGSYAKSRITSGFSGVTITVGAGGAGVSASTGGNGGTSSFGAAVSSPGGNGGAPGSVTTGAIASFGSPNPGAPASGGNIISTSGLSGQYALILSATVGNSGEGAPSHFGPGGFRVQNSTSPGAAGVAPGAAGSGSVTAASSAAQTGGAGSTGIVIVYEYA